MLDRRDVGDGDVDDAGTTNGMTCPRCGADMNHQADKLVYPVTKEEAARMTVALDGVIEEVFACPNLWPDRVAARRERRRLAGSLRRSTGTR
jgi:hypothetical protein